MFRLVARNDMEAAAGVEEGVQAARTKPTARAGLCAADGRGPKGQQPHHRRFFLRRPGPQPHCSGSFHTMEGGLG